MAMKSITQKVNLMSALTSLKSISDKILDTSSLKTKEIRKMIEANSKEIVINKR